MRYALAAGLLGLLSSPCLAQIPPGLPVQDPPQIKRLYDDYYRANEGCRGSIQESVMVRECNRRNRISAQLRRLGYCFGRDGDSVSEMLWHPCNDD